MMHLGDLEVFVGGFLGHSWGVAGQSNLVGSWGYRGASSVHVGPDLQ